MLELDPEGQAQFFEQFSQSVQSSGNCMGTDGIAEFHRKVSTGLEKVCVRRPWAMRLFVCFYQLRLRRHERMLAGLMHVSADALPVLLERLERLRFAVHYGRAGNAKQRTCCLDMLERYRIAPLDAPFLVWNRVIGMRDQSVNFGHWDWILGLFMMHLVGMLFLLALGFALSPTPNPGVKTIITPVYLLMGYGTFTFYKATTFDVFRIGLRYFKPNGWRYRPLPRYEANL